MTHFKRILAVGVACTAMMTHNALAQDGGEDVAQSPHFYPAKAWEVGSITAVSDYSGECIIQTEFNNGFLLQINGSSNWVQQLNLNIRQNAFEVGNHYDVVLKVPGRADEVIKAITNRANIVSVPLKGQKELYKAMRDNGVLDVEIEGNEFRFFLTGFNGAANQFERCMAGGAPGAVAAKNVRADNGDTKAGLGGIEGTEISVTSENLSDAEKDFLVNESIAFEAQEVLAQGDALSSASTIDEEDAVAALNASAVEAIALNSNAPTVKPIKKDLPALEPQSSADEPVIVQAEREEEVEPIVVVMDPPEEADVAVVEAEIIEAAVIDKADMAEETIEVETVPVMPKSDVKASEDFLSEPERSIDMPRVKVNKQTTKGNVDFSTAKLETADSKALAKITALEKDLAKARAENKELNDELRVSLEEAQQEVMSVETDNWNLERATMRFNEAERQMKKLGQQLQKERAQWAMEKKELETMLFDPTVTSQEQLARLSTLEQELAKTQAELDAARVALEVAQ